MSPRHVHLTQLEVSGCTAELYLNGVPLVRLDPTLYPLTNAAAEEYLVGGTNELEVLVEPGRHPSSTRSDTRRVPFRPMKAVARVLKVPDGEPGTVDYGETVAETVFGWAQPPPDERQVPVTTSVAFTMPRDRGGWPWQDAPRLTLDERLVDEACGVLDVLEDALRRGDVSAVLSLVEAKLDDVLRGYPAHTRASLEDELRALMVYVDAADDPVFPRDRKDHDFRLVGGGRLLELLDHDFTTSFALRHHERGTRQPYPLMLARLDGVLRIVR